jgi:hypothetical protein
MKDLNQLNQLTQVEKSKFLANLAIISYKPKKYSLKKYYNRNKVKQDLNKEIINYFTEK